MPTCETFTCIYGNPPWPAPCTRTKVATGAPAYPAARRRAASG